MNDFTDEELKELLSLALVQRVDISNSILTKITAELVKRSEALQLK